MLARIPPIDRCPFRLRKPFVFDSSKNKDVDFDGVEDSLDATLSEFQFNWTKHLDKSMFSAYEKNKLN